MGLQIKAEAAAAATHSDYYVAALRFIDPQLTPDSPLADVHTAAIGRRQRLLQLPLPKSRDDLQALDEALEYVREYRLGDSASGVAQSEPAVEVIEPPVAAALAAAAVPAGRPTADPPPAPPVRPLRQRARLRDAMAQAQPADAVIRPARPRAEATGSAGPPTPRREQPLPEVLAWPVLAGQLLIVWQGWLALFAGWTVARFLIWPGPGVELQLGWPAACGLLALGGTAAAATGTLVWRYRKRSRRLLMLVHLSAGFIALDLAAWRLAASDQALLVDPPRGWYWLLLVAVWLIAAIMAWLHDLRAGERASLPGQAG